MSQTVKEMATASVEEVVSTQQDLIEELLQYLRRLGAADVFHARGRDLLEHLRGTADIVRAWNLPVYVQHAALFHSIYSTPHFKTALVSRKDRGRLRKIIGEQAEELVYCFSMASYENVAEAVIVSSGSDPLPVRTAGEESLLLSWAQLGSLALMHIANVSDQKIADEAGPGRWLSRAARLARALEGNGISLPPFLQKLAAKMSPQAETRARACYEKGIKLAFSSPTSATSEFSLTAELAPVGEPLFWLAVLAVQDGDTDRAANLTEEARSRFLALGTAWDKRWTVVEWLAQLKTLSAGVVAEPVARFLSESSGERTITSGRATTIAPPKTQRVQRSSIGDARFDEYVARLRADKAGRRQAAYYPGLPQIHLHDAMQFPIVAQLESSFDQIRREFDGLHARDFHQEGESISRKGSWDIYMLYERGKRIEEHCERCPTLAALLLSPDCIRSMSGLIYFSRLAPYTRVGAHFGPTNLRVRCHLGISIPKGNCGLEVDGKRLSWREGACLVFDDSFEHCAWNETEEDRTVLIVDLWHPALTQLEINRLEAMQTYTSLMAPRLIKYWNTNNILRQQKKKLYD